MLRSTQKWLNSFVQRLKMKVPRRSAKLSKSIKGVLTQSGKDIIINVEALEYFSYQDRGVSGTKKKYNTPFSYRDKRPPASVFKPYTSTLASQYAMATSIFEKGIKPKNVLQPELDSSLTPLYEAILEDFTRDINL